MKKVKIISLAVFSIALLTTLFYTSCENFNSTQDIKNKLKDEVRYANAPEVNVSFAKKHASHGEFISDYSISKLKQGFPATIGFKMDDSLFYFEGWVAKKNYNKEDEAEIPASQVRFENPHSLITKVELLETDGSAITFVPMCSSHPSVMFSTSQLPDSATLNPENSYQLIKEETLEVSLKLPKQYGFNAWAFSNELGEISVLSSQEYSALSEKPEIYILKSDSVPAKSDPIASKALAIVYGENSSTNEISGDTKYNFNLKLPNDLKSMLYVIPSVYKQPEVNIFFNSGDNEKASLSPEGISVFKIGNDYTVSTETKADYGFNSWSFYTSSVSGTTTIPVLTNEQYASLTPVNKPSVYFYKKNSLSPEESEIYKNATAVICEFSGNTYNNNSFQIRFLKDTGSTLYITPVYYKHPSVNFSLSTSDLNKASMKPSETKVLRLETEYEVSIQTQADYTFSNWNAFYKSGNTTTNVPVYNATTLPVSVIGDYIYVCTNENALYKTAASSQDKKEFTDPVKKSLAVIYNTNLEVSESGATKIVPSFMFIKAPSDDKTLYIEPVFTSHPYIRFQIPQYENKDAGKSSVSPTGKVKEIIGQSFYVEINCDDQYSFDSWIVKNNSGVLLSPSVDTDTDGNQVITYSGLLEIHQDIQEINESRSYARAKVIALGNVDNYTISANTKKRPEIIYCSPANNSSNVYRTTPLKIIFSKNFNPDVFKFDEEGKNPYITLSSKTALTSQELINLSRYFVEPTLSKNGDILTARSIGGDNKTNWLPDNTFITVNVSGSLKDSEGVSLGKDFTYMFSTGYQGDNVGPALIGEVVKYNPVSTSVSDKEIVLNKEYIFKSSDFASISNQSVNDLKSYDNLRIYYPELVNKNSLNYEDVLFMYGITEASILNNEDSVLKIRYFASDDEYGGSGIYKLLLTERLVQSTDEKLYDINGSTSTFNNSNTGGYTESNTTLSIEFEDDYQNPNHDTDENRKEIGLNFNIPVDGVHEYTLTATDTMLNKSDSSIRVYVVRDTTPPTEEDNISKITRTTTPVYSDSSDNYFIAGSDIQYTVTNLIDKFVTDNSTKVSLGSDSIYYALGLTAQDPLLYGESSSPVYGSYKLYDKNNASESISITLPDPALTEEKDSFNYYIWLKLMDKAGNENAFYLDNEKGKLTVSKKLPVVNNFSIYDGYAFDIGDTSNPGVSGGTVNFTFTATDEFAFKDNGFSFEGLKITKYIDQTSGTPGTPVTAAGDEGLTLPCSSTKSNYVYQVWGKLTDTTDTSDHYTLKLNITNINENTLSKTYEIEKDITPPVVSSIKIYNAKYGENENIQWIPGSGKFNYAIKDPSMITVKVEIQDEKSGISHNNPFVFVGLDSDPAKEPQFVSDDESPIGYFKLSQFNSFPTSTVYEIFKDKVTCFVQGLPDISYITDNKYKVILKVTDRVGNITTTDPLYINIDNAGPVVTVSDFQDISSGNTEYTDGDVMFKVKVRDQQSGLYPQISFTGLYPDNITYSLTKDGDYTSEIPFTKGTTDEQVFWVKGTTATPITTDIGITLSDIVGNETSSTPYSFIRDNDSPVISTKLYSTKIGETMTEDSDEKVTFSITMTDALSGLDFITVTGFDVAKTIEWSTDNGTNWYSVESSEIIEDSIKFNLSGRKTETKYLLRGDANKTEIISSKQNYKFEYKVNDKVTKSVSGSNYIVVDKKSPSISGDIYDSQTGNMSYTSGEVGLVINLWNDSTASGKKKFNKLYFEGFETNVQYFVKGYEDSDQFPVSSSDWIAVPDGINYIDFTGITLPDFDVFIKGTPVDAETQYSFKYWADDIFGNSNESNAGNLLIKKDKTPPVISISELQDASSKNTSYTNGDVKFKVTVSDVGSGINSSSFVFTGLKTSDLQYSSDGTTYTSTLPSEINNTNDEKSFWVKGTALNSSTTDFSVTVKDNVAFEITTNTLSISRDNTNPTGTSISLYDTSAGTTYSSYSNGDLTYSVTVQDTVSGLSGILFNGFDINKVRYFTINGGSQQTISAGTGSIIQLTGTDAKTVKIWGTGSTSSSSYTISHKIYDAVGNTSVDSKSITKDVHPPFIWTLETQNRNGYSADQGVSDKLLQLRANVYAPSDYNVTTNGFKYLYVYGLDGCSPTYYISGTESLPSSPSFKTISNNKIDLSSFGSDSDIYVFIRATISDNKTVTVYTEDSIGNIGSSYSANSSVYNNNTSYVPHRTKDIKYCDYEKAPSIYSLIFYPGAQTGYHSSSPAAIDYVSNTLYTTMRANVYEAGSSYPCLKELIFSGFDTSKTIEYYISTTQDYNSSAQWTTLSSGTSKIDLTSQTGKDLYVFVRGNLKYTSTTSGSKTTVSCYASNRLGFNGSGATAITANTNESVFKRSREITIDSTIPTVTSSLSVSRSSRSSTTATVSYSISSSTDTQSGINCYKIWWIEVDSNKNRTGSWKSSPFYTYSGGSKTDTYSVTGLTSGATYEFSISVYDKVHNQTDSSAVYK